MQKGTDINKIFFIRFGKSGAPKLKMFKQNVFGVIAIECTNVGKTYEQTKHLKKVRVKIKNKNGEIDTFFVSDVYTEVTEEFIDRWNKLYYKWRDSQQKYIDKLEKQFNMLQNKVDTTSKKLYILGNRYRKSINECMFYN